jgi:class 3 adenylate cyclase/tetratricopeptide (TPR) repeat protein
MPLSPVDASRFTRATKIIVVADVVESVRLMEQDEQEFIGRWHRFVNFVQEQVPQVSGRLHKSLGDGLMLEFSDQHGCIRATLAMQAWFHEGNQGLPPEDRVHLRIGAHLADFVADKYDIYGTDVNLAARIATLAGPGEIVISAALRERLGRKPTLPLEDLGTCHLKHVKRPVHAFRIGQAGGAPVLPSPPFEAHGLRTSVAVLPFTSHGEAAEGVSGETLADELVVALARSDVLQVVSRMTATSTGGTREVRSPVLGEVGARYLLSGRAHLHGGELALHAELAETQSGHVVWAEHFTGAPCIAGAIDPKLLARMVPAVHAAIFQREVERATQGPMPSLDGSTLLLAAIGLMHRLSPVDMEQARQLLDHLADRWRRQALVHAWIAHLHLLRVQQAFAGVSGHDQALARAHAAAAVQYDPSSPVVLAMDGYACVHGARNLQGAEDRFAQALSQRGDHSLALLFQAELLALQGEAGAARAVMVRAMQQRAMEPLAYLYDAIAALAAWADGDAEAAIPFARRALERNPRYLPAWRTLVVSQVETERLGEARVAQQRLMRRQPSFSVASFLAGTAMCEELASRFAEGLLQAGTPPG